jgi:hypothetical protein
MRVELGMKRGSRNKDPKLARIRQAMTAATDKYGIGGVEKRKGHKPRPVTLPKVELKDFPE